MKSPPPWSLPIKELNRHTGEIAAVRAIAEGTADQHQQRLGFNFIMSRLCGADAMSFWPGGEDGKRATDFAEGRRWVGIQLRRIVKLLPDRYDTRGPPPPMPAAREAEDEPEGAE